MHLRHLLAMGGLLLGAASCAQILGDDFRIDGDESDDDTGSASGTPGCVDSCDGCVAYAAEACCNPCGNCYCAAELEACNQNSDCAAFDSCFAGCDELDEICQGDCYNAYQVGGELAFGVFNCLSSACPNSCYNQCAGGGA